MQLPSPLCPVAMPAFEQGPPGSELGSSSEDVVSRPVPSACICVANRGQELVGGIPALRQPLNTHETATLVGCNSKRSLTQVQH